MTSGYSLHLSDAELARYAMMAQAARASEADLWTSAGIVPGAVVADVGCGPGALFPAVVDAIGVNGRLVGVDGDPGAVAAGRSLVEAAGWDNVDVRAGRADATGLEPGGYDVVMMRHVLAHNMPQEQAIVDHLATLVRPAGHVYLVDIVGDGLHVRPTDPDVEDLNAAYQRFHATKGNDLRVGLRLDLLAQRAGLEIMTYRGWYNIMQVHGAVRPPAWAARDAMVAAGVASTDDVARWERGLDRLVSQQPTVFASVFAAVARRPD